MDTHLPVAGPAAGGSGTRPRPALDPRRLAAARAALAAVGPVRRQEPIEWAAEEPLAPDLADFYRHVGPEWVEVDTLGLPFLLFPLERLWDEQAGYRWSRRTGARLADWDEDWTAVALQGADPFIHQASTGHVLMVLDEKGWEDRTTEPVPVFEDVVEMMLALCAVGAAWAGADDPFTPDWHVRPEVADAVVAGLTGVLGTAERALPLARALGYPAAG